MDKYEKKLKIYEIWQQIIFQANKEFYLLATALVVVFSALLRFSNKDLSLSWVGLVGATFWFLASLTQLMWKKNWTGRVQRLEEMIIDNEKDDIFTSRERELIRKDKKRWDPKFFCISLHLTFILSLIPMIFIVLFGVKLKLLNIEWILISSKHLIFIAIIAILMYKLVQASYCWKPYPRKEDEKRFEQKLEN